MGLVKPPWVSQKFFESVPFNYCDHFGNKEKLALLCKICREWIVEGHGIENGKDLEDPVNFLMMLHASKEPLNKTRKKLYLFQKSDRFANYAIYEKVVNYSEAVGYLIEKLSKQPKEHFSYVLALTVSSLAHSEHYIISKIRRALFNLSKSDRFDDDSKTSALLADLAITRNSRMCDKLLQEINDGGLKKELRIFSEIGFSFSREIRATFFPEFEGEFEEFGAEEYF